MQRLSAPPSGQIEQLCNARTYVSFLLCGLSRNAEDAHVSVSTAHTSSSRGP